MHDYCPLALPHWSFGALCVHVAAVMYANAPSLWLDSLPVLHLAIRYHFQDGMASMAGVSQCVCVCVWVSSKCGYQVRVSPCSFTLLLSCHVYVYIDHSNYIV
eukprot:scpid106664/ scgid20148/ 